MQNRIKHGALYGFLAALTAILMLSVSFGSGCMVFAEENGQKVPEKYRGASDAARDAIFQKKEIAWDLEEGGFEGFEDWKANSHLMIASYDTKDPHLENVAFSYDNALAAMALMAADYPSSAEDFLDSFVYACNHDRYKAGRVRNAYMAGNILPFPNTEELGARLPGWYDEEKQQWNEDRYQVGCNVGNTSYVAIALLQYDALYGSEEYRKTAAKLMDWVIEDCSDDSDGFTGGYDGWPESDPPDVNKFTYKSIEHNIDAYAAFTQLYKVTGKKKYLDAAESARKFINSMYDEKKGVFYSGTYDDGVTPNKENIVLDAQVWAAMALGSDFGMYKDSLKVVEDMLQPGGGYAFCRSNKNGGWWAEGTAFTALMYRLRGEDEKASAALDSLCSIQTKSGLFPAATTKNLSTGFYQFDGSPLEYSDDPHVAPAAWFILAVNGFNPYDFSHEKSGK